MDDFTNDTIRRTKKPHICALCENKIEIGEYYHRQRGKLDGKFFDNCLHISCNNIIEAFCDETGYLDFYPGWVRTWLEDLYCDNCEYNIGCDVGDVFQCELIKNKFSEPKQFPRMEINDYQELALRTANKVDKINAALGLCGESGEVADLIKKYEFQDHILEKTKIVEELGDVMWYVAMMSAALGVSLEEVMITNINKLKRRYPDGFEKEKSINREE